MILSAVEIAQKHRYLHLLQKVKENKALMAAELKELKNYEDMSARMVQKSATQRQTRKRDARGRFKAAGGQRIKVRVNEDQIKALSAELENLAAIEAGLDEHVTDIFQKYPRIKTAWERVLTRQLETMLAALESKFAAAQKDYRKVTLKQLMEITDKSRRTIYDWLKKGLPRNADGSFDLATFISWFERYTIEKLPSQVIADINPLQSMKAKRLEIDLARQRNQLLNRAEAMAGLIARHQNLINALSHKAEELALICNGQPQAKIAELLNDFFDELLSRQCQVPESLRLPDEIAEQFTKLLEGLRSEGE